MAFTTLISTAALALHHRRSGVRHRRLPLQARRSRRGANANTRAAHIPGAVYARPRPRSRRSQNWDERPPSLAGSARRLHKHSAGSASRAACRSSPTTRTTACTRAGSGGCCAGWGTTPSRCSTAGSRNGWRKAGRRGSGAEQRAAARVRRLAAHGDGDRRDAGRVASRHVRWQLVDARAPERYRGETEPIDKTPATFPAPRIISFNGTSTTTGRSARPRSCASGWRESIGDVAADRVVCYCGSGVTACHNLLALEHAGLTGAKLYAGSWSEWSADPSRPVEKG